jgi:predicted dehydrogenase
MTSELKIGLLGLDTSHVPAFAQILNDPSHAYHVPGGRITSAFRGGSPDFELSFSRVEGFTKRLREEFQVAILDSPQEVAGACDAIMLTAVDGRAHLPLFEAIAPFGKPVFIDKPFATSSADASAMTQLAQKHDVKLMSCSSLRYAQPLVETLIEAVAKNEALVGADCSGPMSLEPTQPGFFWYGIHSVEMLYAALGAGCVHVTATGNDQHDLLTAQWRDGRIGTVRGNRIGNQTFGALLHSAKQSRFVNAFVHPKPAYAGLLERIVPMFAGGEAPIELEETLEIVRFIEAANTSWQSGEKVVL